MSVDCAFAGGANWRRLGALILTTTVLLAAAFLVLVQVSPWYVGMGDDSGLFAYGGQRILHGDLLYRDVWDTKPPGVFYLNALALALGGETPWAIWWFQVIWIGLVAIGLFMLLGRLAGWAAGFLATGLFLFTALYPDYFQGGNLTEVYALLPQVLGLVAAAGFFRAGKRGWLVAAGFATGIAFVLKPTYVALGGTTLWVAAGLAFRRGGWRAALGPVASVVTGFFMPLLGVALFWGVRGGLDELWAAVFRHNVGYVQAGLSLRSLYGTVRAFFVTPPLVFLTALSAGGLARYVLDRDPATGELRSQMLPGFGFGSAALERGDWRRSVFAVGVLALPLEAASVALSGRNFGHYFLTPLPAMAVAIAYLLQDLMPALSRLRTVSVWHGISLTLVGALLVAWGLQVGAREIPQRMHLADLTRRSLSGEYWTDELEQYVAAHTSASESVLVWGYNPGLHFLTDRRAPSGYLFHAQFFTPSLEAQQRFNRFLGDLTAYPPALIVAQPESPHAIPFFGAEASCPDCTLPALDQLAMLREFVESRYELVGQVDGWVIYQVVERGA